MTPRSLSTLALLLAVFLFISSEIITATEMAEETSADHEAKTASGTKEVIDEKYSNGGYPGYNGGYPGNGGGYPGNGGGYPGNGGGYPGNGGGYPGNGGGYPGHGGSGGGGPRGCYHGCCYRGYSGCRRCCSYAGEAVQTDVEAKPQN